MNPPRLELLVIHVPGRSIADPSEQAQETSRLATEVVAELERAISKCQTINQIDGASASIIGLMMTGRLSVETIGITYISDGQTRTKEYPIESFYRL